MKTKLLYTIIFLLFVALIVYIIFRPTTQAVQLSQPDKLGYRFAVIDITKIKNPKYLTQVNMSGYNGYKDDGKPDTFLINSNTSSWLLQQDTGMVFINANKFVKVNGGVLSENCKDIAIIGRGSNDPYGFEFRGGGITGNFSGMYDGLTILNCRWTGGRDGPLWVKSEAGHACDFQNYWSKQPEPGKSMYGDPYSYLAPSYQDHITVQYCWIDSSGGDTYFGSTGGIDGRDVVPCLGNQKLPTMQIRNVDFSYNYVNYLGRSGFQLSVCTAGDNKINHNVITNCGYEWPETGGDQAKSQGAGIRIGSGTVNTEVGWNVVKYTNIYNYDIAEGNCNVHDNFGDSVSWIIYHGQPFACGQAIPSMIVSSGHKQKNKLFVNNNEMRHTTGGQNIAYAVYGGKNFVLESDTCQNIGKLAILATPFPVVAGCNLPPPVFKDSTFVITHDTIVTERLPPLIVKTFDSLKIDTVSAQYVKLGGVQTYKVISRNVNWTQTKEQLPERDTIATKESPPHDTTIKVRTKSN